MDKPYYLYVGNAYPHKNLERAMKAVVQLNEEVIFAIASARSIFTERLRKLIARNNWQNKIKLLGFVSNADLTSLYRHAVGYLSPAISEGFGLPVLEAMLAGTICLCSDIPISREIYQDKVLYFNPVDVNSIAGALREALNMNKDVREKMIREGKTFVKRYSWSTMAQETLKIYESCAGL